MPQHRNRAESEREDIEAGDMLRDEQVAKLLDIAEPTLRAWRSRKQGPAFIRIGPGSVRYLRTDVLAFINANRVACGGEK